MDKVKLLKDILGSYHRSSDEYLFHCPYCNHHKRKLSVNTDKNFYKCWVCDTRGRSLRRIVRRFGSFSQLQEWDKLEGRTDISLFDQIFAAENKKPEQKQRLNLPEEFVSLVNENLSLSCVKAKGYLKKRGITEKDIIRWKIGYCIRGNYEGRIVVPSFDEEGYVNYFIARTYERSWKKYMNPPVSKNIVFNELYIDWDSDLILVEGIFDAIKAGPNSIPLLGSTLREKSQLFKQIVKNDTPVFLALDEDAKKKSMHIIKKFLLYGTELYDIDVSGYEDVGEMSKEEFTKRKEVAKYIDPESYLLEYSLNHI